MAHWERILSSYTVNLGMHTGTPGTKANPWEQVPISNFPGFPKAEMEPSQCLPLAAWLLSGKAFATSRRYSPHKASAATDSWHWRWDRPSLFFLLLGLVPWTTLQHIRHYFKIKMHTFANQCDSKCNWVTNVREKVHHRENTTN